MRSELEELSSIIKMELQSNTVVLFFVPKDKCKRVAETLKCMAVWGRYGITPIAVPEDIYVQALTPGTDFVVSRARNES